MKTFMLLVLTSIFGLSSAVAAPQIEAWKKGEKLVFADRNVQGQFVGWGELRLESWNDGDDKSEWVARKANGQFVTGYKGALEKFKVAKSAKERTRLVIRKANGQFVTWADMDKFLTAGWERWENGWVYVIRYNGQFVNWAKAKFEKWAGFGDVLVVRDSSDCQNNGKILTWIAAEKVGNRAFYRDPKSGRFIAAKN